MNTHPQATPSGDQPSMPLSRHIRRTFLFAAPIIVSRAALLIMFTVDAIMTGRAGPQELAYLGVGVAPQLTLFLIAIGAMQAVVILIAQAIGAETPERCGEILRIGMIHATLLGLVVFALSAFGEAFFLVTGQSPEIAAGAARVTVAFGIGVPGMLLFLVANMFLEATDRPTVGMWIMVAVNILNVGLNGIFALGWLDLLPPMGAVGTMLASSVLRWLAFFTAIVFIIRAGRRDGDSYEVLAPLSQWWHSFRTLGGPIGLRIGKLGVPMGLAQGVESAAFAAIMLIAGTLGTAAVAAHQVTMTLMSLVFMMAIGTAGATAIRVGNAVGRGNAADIRHAGWSGIGIGAVLPIPAAALFILMPRDIASVFTDDAEVLEIAEQMVRIAGMLVSFDAIMGVTAGALRGIADVWMPFLMQSTAFWCIGVPAAYLFSYQAGFGAVGLIFGIASGLAISIPLLVTRFKLIAGRAFHDG